VRGKGSKLGELDFGIFTFGIFTIFGIRDFYIRDYFVREKFVAPTKHFRKLKKNLNSSGEKCSGISDGFFKILHLALGATG
jgi:hypothetical protein